jgi:asparagine synthase (glutamine-hydrolysing)
MCGIIAFLDVGRALAPARYDAIAGAMADRLAHRGPDDRGVWTDPHAGIGLGFRRLAVLDPSPAGHQPMHSADGSLVMVFNGEIYNYRALRAALEAEGAGPWRGHGDSEVLLEAIARWGLAAALERANGMFAIAVWDKRARRLLLARDRFGEKPLYYGRIGKTLLVASELKALEPHPAWTGATDRGALELFLNHGYIPAPWTAFAGMRKLAPGCRLAIGPDGGGEPVPYWSATAHAAAAAASPFTRDAGAAGEALQALIDDAVALRMEADVRLGAFLSGGIDSATVAAAMQRAGRGQVKSFTVGFPDVGHDESREAEAVARHLGTDHTTLRVSDAECRDALPHLAAVYDEPFADPSQIPTLVLCRLTRGHVTVSLSGDGGDEFFGGYDRYGAAARAWRRLERWPRAVRHGARATVGLRAGHELRPLRRLRRIAGRIAHDSPESLYRDYVSRWHAGDRLVYGRARYETLLDAPLEAGPPSLEQRFMLRDATTYLPDDLLVKIDRASMAFGLEVRAPLLDHRIAAFAWSLPPPLADGKRLLRAMLYRRVPQALVDRPKRGFDPPIARWLREGLREWADGLLDRPRLEQHGIVNPALVAARWRAHRSGQRNWAQALWPVLMLEAWLDHRAGIAPIRADSGERAAIPAR